MAEKDFEVETTETETLTVCDYCATEVSDPVTFQSDDDRFPELHLHPEHVDKVTLDDTGDVVRADTLRNYGEYPIKIAATNGTLSWLVLAIVGMSLAIEVGSGALAWLAPVVSIVGWLAFLINGWINAKKPLGDLLDGSGGGLLG